jgi:hypothetical protein
VVLHLSSVILPRLPASTEVTPKLTLAAALRATCGPLRGNLRARSGVIVGRQGCGRSS